MEYFKSQLGTRYVEFNSYLNRPGLPGFLSGLRDAVRNLGRGGRARRDESILGDAP